MDELTIDGKIYVSSKRAAAITGYAKDYIGQLCREGRVEAKLVGRSWYVYEPSLKKHRFSDETSDEPKKAETAWGAAMHGEKEEPAEKISEKTNIHAVWDVPSYMPEEVTVLPELTPEPPVEAPKEPEVEQNDGTEPLSDMQSAWQEWFSTRTAVDASPSKPMTSIRDEGEEVPTAHPQPDSRPYAVPLRTIVSDIAPISPKDEPVRPSYVPTAAAVPVHVSRASVPSRLKKRSSKHQRVVEVVLIAIMVVSASAALVSTGIIEALHIGGTADIGLIRFLEGETLLK